MKLLNLIEEKTCSNKEDAITKEERMEKQFDIISNIGRISNIAKINPIGLDRLLRRMCLDNNMSIEDTLKVEGKQAIRLDKALVQSNKYNNAITMKNYFNLLVDCDILAHHVLKDRYELYTFKSPKEDTEYGCEFIDYYGNIVLYAYIDRIDCIIEKLNKYIDDRYQEFKYKKFFHWYY